MIQELIAEIELFAAPELQEDYDNAGLLTGDAGWICTGVLCTLDVTLRVIEEAITNHCNLIIAHHPVIFRGLKRITGKTSVERVIIQAIKHNIAIYAVHSNLDNVILGVNGMISSKLGLTNCNVLQPKSKPLRRLITFAPIADAETIRKAIFDAGAGHIGNYSECSFNSNGTGTFKAGTGARPFVGEVGKQHQENETKIEIVYPFYLEQQVIKALISHHPYEEVAYDILTLENQHYGIGAGIIGELDNAIAPQNFLNRIKEVFKVGAIKHTDMLKKDIKKVAVCGGSGSFLIKTAIAKGADIYISSDFKYHEFFDTEERLIIADVGHYESEQFTVDLLYEILVKKFPTFAILKTSINTNPVRYYI